MKKAISLFCCAMLLSACLAAPAQAAFSDQEDIVHTEAVELLVKMNLVQGTETGAFDPEGPVTRAEMVKMICIAKNGGVAPFEGTNTPTLGEGLFSDVEGHWAAQYIGYCADNLKMLSGRGDGTFDPDASISGNECAKLLLITIGYFAENEGFEGVDWAAKVEGRADEAKLFVGLEGLDRTAPLSRDNAAQLVANGVQASLIQYEYQLYSQDGNLVSVAIPVFVEPAETILTRYYPNL